jgi:hypothetical protein
VARIKKFPNLIYNEKFHGLSPRRGGPRAAPVHGGPWTRLRRRLIGGQLEWRPREWNLTTVEEEGGGNRDEPHRLQEGRRRDANGRASMGNNRWRRRSVWAVLGHGEKRREVGRGPVKPEVGAHPFIGAGEGHAGRERGNGRRQWP